MSNLSWKEYEEHIAKQRVNWPYAKWPYNLPMFHCVTYGRDLTVGAERIQNNEMLQIYNFYDDRVDEDDTDKKVFGCQKYAEMPETIRKRFMRLRICWLCSPREFRMYDSNENQLRFLDGKSIHRTFPNNSLYGIKR